MATHDSQQFYDSLASSYDTMIPFDQRLRAARGLAKRLLDQAPVSRAIDCATGTGLFAMALAEAGISTIGADLSAEMIAQARRRTAHYPDLDLRWLVAPMEELAEHVDEPLDLILCLGNSLPHLLEDEALHQALQGWRELLRPGGRLLIQLLNYQRVLADGERIVAITRQDDQQFIRFYDFLDETIRFNVLRISWADGQASHDLESVPLRPYRHEALTAALHEHGFELVEASSDLAGNPFDPETSKTLVLQAS